MNDSKHSKRGIHAPHVGRTHQECGLQQIKMLRSYSVKNDLLEVNFFENIFHHLNSRSPRHLRSQGQLDEWRESLSKTNPPGIETGEAVEEGLQRGADEEDNKLMKEFDH